MAETTQRTTKRSWRLTFTDRARAVVVVYREATARRITEGEEVAGVHLTLTEWTGDHEDGTRRFTHLYDSPILKWSDGSPITLCEESDPVNVPTNQAVEELRLCVLRLSRLAEDDLPYSVCDAISDTVEAFEDYVNQLATD